MDNKNATNEYRSKMLEKITLQDAVTIIAISAAQVDLDKCRYVDPTSCQDAVRFIRKKESNLSVFDEDPERTSERINLFMNFIQTLDFRMMLEKAFEIVKENNMARTAYELAVKVALKDNELTAEKTAVLDDIASYLGIEGDVSEKPI